MLTKRELAEKIIRRFGYPVVKVELEWEHIYDAIDYARDKWLKWSSGQSTNDNIYFTMLLSAGQNLYDLPVGVREVITYISDSGGWGSVNTLFTLDNYLYNSGLYDGILGMTRYGGAGAYGAQSIYNGYNLITYHITLDFLETLKRYSPEKYDWRYHRFTNQLEIHPAPPSGNFFNVYESDGTIVEVDSPGYALIRASMVEGSTYMPNWKEGDSDEYFYGSQWILDYAEAMAKVTLGRIRRKFENFSSIGNTGIALDGADLIQEGREDMEKLYEQLKEEESYVGGEILIG
jgi:hypothetical protein